MPVCRASGKKIRDLAGTYWFRNGIDASLFQFRRVVPTPRANDQLFASVAPLCFFQIAWLNVHVDLPEIRRGTTRHGIVAQQVLRPKFVADLLEGLLELSHTRRVVILSTSVVRDLDERVLAAGVASGACFHRDIDQA